MCFIKKASSSIPKIEKQEPVERHEANASLTKNSSDNPVQKGLQQNTRTSAIGLQDEANTNKKILLGE